MPAPDPAFTAHIVTLLGAEADRCGIAVLDLSDPARPRYAEHRGDYQQNAAASASSLSRRRCFSAWDHSRIDHCRETNGEAAHGRLSLAHNNSPTYTCPAAFDRDSPGLTAILRAAYFSYTFHLSYPPIRG
jgi:hypothetical protein